MRLRISDQRDPGLAMPGAYCDVLSQDAEPTASSPLLPSRSYQQLAHPIATARKLSIPASTNTMRSRSPFGMILYRKTTSWW